MDSTELAFAGIVRQAALVRAGEVSSRELVELYLERIERLDPKLNAFRVVMAEKALAEADAADARRGDDERAAAAAESRSRSRTASTSRARSRATAPRASTAPPSATPTWSRGCARRAR